MGEKRSQDMGEKVAEAVMRVGYDGSTTTESHEDFVDVVEFAEGLEHEVGLDPSECCKMIIGA